MRFGKVVLFGDSVARGIILGEDGTYSPTPDSFAERAAGRLGLSLVNKARFGCTIAKGLDIARRFLSRETERNGTPELALLEFGGNDCDFRWDEIADRPADHHDPTTPLALFSKLYSEMIGELKAAGLSPVLMTLPPLEAERYFDWITRKGLNRQAILSWLGDVGMIYRWHEGYDQEVRKIAVREDCPLADVRKAFLDSDDYGRYICQDGIHPNRLGHALIEDKLLSLAATVA
ncbi:MAG: SGNH/GDSL hydrolase family protein [Spirochaetes bacterium]|nr:SGNH/GDSL hydrolase family protein [Spirochaetota bacterium]